MGKMLLAGLTDAELDDLYAGQSLERRTRNTITALAELKERLAAARQARYIVDDQELEPDLCCVAAPVFGSGGRLVASLSISGPSSRINAETIPVIAGKVIHAARSVSDNLGAPASIDGWQCLAPRDDPGLTALGSVLRSRPYPGNLDVATGTGTRKRSR
jgi:IclR family acetate operon transcriptional repressor